MNENIDDKKLKSDLIYFSKKILDIEFGNDKRVWSNSLSFKKICIESDRDTGKSTFWSLVYPLWKTFNGKEGQRGCIIALTQDVAKKRLSSMLELLQNTTDHCDLLYSSKIYESLHGVKNIQLHKNMVIGGIGWNCIDKMAGMSEKFDWIVVDDVSGYNKIDVSSASYKSENAKLSEYDIFKSCVETMLVPGGQIIVVGTAETSDCLINKLAADDGFLTVSASKKDNQQNSDPTPPTKDEIEDRAIKAIEKRHNGTFITSEKFEKECPVFYQTIMDDLKRFSNDNKFIFLMHQDSEESFRYSVIFFTSKHEYKISCKDSSLTPDSYLGATVNSRSFRAGEYHVRGNDLHDGKFTTGTWNNILADIVSYELVNQEVIPIKENNDE